MKGETAFNFIPELIGDVAYVKELSNSPKTLYVKSVLNALQAVANIFGTFEEYKNTKSKIRSKQAIQNVYDDLKTDAVLNYQIEEIQRLNIEFESIKIKIQKEEFSDKEVRGFIKRMEMQIQRVLEILHEFQSDPDYPDKTVIEEATRKLLRDYGKLLSLYIEEEEK